MGFTGLYVAITKFSVLSRIEYPSVKYLMQIFNPLKVTTQIISLFYISTTQNILSDP
jgi:hypothetical protein